MGQGMSGLMSSQFLERNSPADMRNRGLIWGIERHKDRKEENELDDTQ